MAPTARSVCKELCSSVEGRSAIYVEKAVYYVKVTDTAYDLGKRIISARVESVRAPGLEGLTATTGNARYRPKSWRFSAGCLTRFSEHNWYMGYGGWSLYFNPKIVEKILDLAAGWDPSLHMAERYRNTLRALEELDANEPTRRVFRD